MGKPKSDKTLATFAEAGGWIVEEGRKVDPAVNTPRTKREEHFHRMAEAERQAKHRLLREEVLPAACALYRQQAGNRRERELRGDRPAKEARMYEEAVTRNAEGESWVLIASDLCERRELPPDTSGDALKKRVVRYCGGRLPKRR